MKYKKLKPSSQSGQVLFIMAQWFWKRLKCEKLTDDGCHNMAKAYIAFN